MRLEDLGLIGNCQFSALIERTGSIVWCCLPRFDSEPVFSTLLDAREGGHFRAGPADGSAGTQRYLENANVLETTFDTPEGGVRFLLINVASASPDLDLAPLYRVDATMDLEESTLPDWRWSEVL